MLSAGTKADAGADALAVLTNQPAFDPGGRFFPIIFSL
jgi:hypothetical protein